MTSGQWIGLIGGIAGGLIGVAGGIVGTYFSIKNTRGPKERQFMVQQAATIWVVLTTLALVNVLCFVFARKIYWYVYGVSMAVFFVALTPWILWSNKRQQLIAQSEAAEKINAP